jgi:hypothetical protein
MEKNWPATAVQPHPPTNTEVTLLAILTPQTDGIQIKKYHRLAGQRPAAPLGKQPFETSHQP